MPTIAFTGSYRNIAFRCNFLVSAPDQREEWLTKPIRIWHENGPVIVVGLLKEVRNLRQSPARRSVDDEFSIKYQGMREKLIAEPPGS